MRFVLDDLKTTDRYKLIAGLIVPRPIAFVTTLGANGRHNAAPYSFFNAFSEDPPLVVLGVGANVRGEDKDTGVNIRDGGEFVVNLVDEPLAAAMNLCAVDFPPEISEIDVAGLELVPSELVAPARLKASPVSLECVHYQTLHPGRNRYLVIGEIKVIHVADEVIDAATLRVDRVRYAPIGRLFGGGYCRTHDRFEIPRLSHDEEIGKMENK
ncbi:MAG: flavin reductase family protein [Rhizobiales bacterium]|nr:flavin reductase family protein [Hyphomicrobiales bacterium]